MPENETVFNFPISGKALGGAIVTIVAGAAVWFGNGHLGSADAGPNAEIEAVRAVAVKNSAKIEELSDLENQIKGNQRSTERNFNDVERTLKENGADIGDIQADLDGIKIDIRAATKDLDGILCFLKKEQRIYDPSCGAMGIIKPKPEFPDKR